MWWKYTRQLLIFVYFVYFQRESEFLCEKLCEPTNEILDIMDGVWSISALFSSAARYASMPKPCTHSSRENSFSSNNTQREFHVSPATTAREQLVEPWEVRRSVRACLSINFWCDFSVYARVIIIVLGKLLLQHTTQYADEIWLNFDIRESIFPHLMDDSEEFSEFSHKIGRLPELGGGGEMLVKIEKVQDKPRSVKEGEFMCK